MANNYTTMTLTGCCLVGIFANDFSIDNIRQMRSFKRSLYYLLTVLWMSTIGIQAQETTAPRSTPSSTLTISKMTVCIAGVKQKKKAECLVKNSQAWDFCALAETRYYGVHSSLLGISCSVRRHKSGQWTILAQSNSPGLIVRCGAYCFSMAQDEGLFEKSP